MNLTTSMMRCRKPLATLTVSFIISVIGILVFSALAKGFSHYTDAELAAKDLFVSFLTSRQLLYLAIMFECLAVGGLIWCLRKYRSAGLMLVLWVSIIFGVYRLGFLSSPLKVSSVCKCFGGAGGLVGKHSDHLAWAFIFYMAIGAGLLLLCSNVVVPRKVNGVACV